MKTVIVMVACLFMSQCYNFNGIDYKDYLKPIQQEYISSPFIPDTITVQVNLDTLIPFYAYQFNINYDSTEIKYIKSSPNMFQNMESFYIAKNIISDSTPYISIGNSLLGHDNCISETGTLLTISFVRLKPIYNISVSKQIFLDCDLNDIFTNKISLDIE